MTLLLGLSFAVISGLIGLSMSTELRKADYTATCHEIAAAVSSASKVYYSGKCSRHSLPQEGPNYVQGRPITLWIIIIGPLPIFNFLHAPLSLQMLRMSESL